MKIIRIKNILGSALLFAFLLCVPPCSAMAQGAWPNEPAGSQTIYDCGFDNGDNCGLIDDFRGQTNYYANDPAAPMSPSSVLDEPLFPGATTGTGAYHYPLNNAREVFVGTWWKTNAEFEGMCNLGNKMLFVRGTGSGDNSLLAWYGPVGIGGTRTLMWYQQGVVNNCHVQGFDSAGCWPQDGTGRFWPNVSDAGTVAAGSGWHRIELYLKASTSDTSQDGIIRLWVDGTLTTDHTNVNISSGGFDEFNLNHTWDGSACLVQRNQSLEWHHYWDHLYISLPNCPPEGCPVTGNTGGSGGGAGSTYKPRQVHTKYINLRPGEVAELKHKSKRNFFQIYGVPPICSLSAGTFNSTSQAWELTKAEMDTVKLTCPPEFCGSVSLTVLSLENKNSLMGQ